MRGSLSRFALYLALVSQLGLAACQNETTYHGKSAAGGVAGGFLSTYNIGEKVFVAVRARLAASAVRPQEKTAAFDARREDFINAVNAILTPDALQPIGSAIKAFFELVDDGTLPRMADNLADVLESLVNEPRQATLQAFLDLGATRSAVAVGDALEFTARTINYPALDQVFAAIAELVRENDGVDDRGRRNGEPDLVHDVLAFASRLLREAGQAPAPSAGAGLFAGLSEDLLAFAAPRPGAPLGGPAWAVRRDANGNPAVLADANGALLPPFVDLDRDGVADVDANGDPIDASGQPIRIPPFAPPGSPGYDAEGRALAASGALLYDFFDAKKTVLSLFLQLGGEAMRRRIHGLAVDVGEIALGPRVANENGTPGDPSDDFLGFERGNAVADLVWGLLEIAKYDDLPVLLRAIVEVGRTDPALAERLLVETGRLFEKVRPIALAPSTKPPSQQSRDLADRAILLLDQVFDRGTQPSTGRILFDVVHRLGRIARNLPSQIARMVEYKTLVVDANGNVDPARSVLVDWTRPATRAGSPAGENRSVLHQLLDLVAKADTCGTVGPFGPPLSETIIELMAGRSAGTVSTLIDLAQSPLVAMYLAVACPAIRDDVKALAGLKASGALEGFLPIAKVFVDQGRTRLLVDILVTLDRSYADVVRPYEPVLGDVLSSGGVEVAFDLIDHIVAGLPGGQPIVDPVSGARAIDVIADAIAHLVHHPAAGVSDRMGRKQPSLAHLLLDPLRRIDDLIYAAAGGQALSNALGYAVTDLFVERVVNDNGTPADPSDDFEQLANPALAPFLLRMLETLARNVPIDAAARASKLAGVQADADSFFASRDFAAAVDLGRTLRTAAGADAIREAAIHLLTPDPVAQDDVFGSMLKVVAGVLETRVDPAPLRQIARFAGELFDPGASRIVGIVTGVSRLLEADQGKVFITLVRNALNAPPASAGLPAGESPAEVLFSVLADVRAAGAAGGPANRLADLAGALQAAIDFIRDPQGGLERIFDIIRNRPKH
jgi:hypothetical protein